MSVTASEVERRLRVSVEALRKSGLRVTHQRLEVAREIARTDTHPHVETIYQGVQQRVPTISLDTVYRTLTTLADLGLVTRVDATAGATRYDANLDRHHHFVCTRCGLIRDVYSSTLDGIEPPEETAGLGSVESVRVQLRGVCRDCQRKETSSER